MNKLILISLFTLINTHLYAEEAKEKIDIFLVRGLVRSIEYSLQNNEILKKELQEKLNADVKLHSFELSGNGRLFQEESPTSIEGMIFKLKAQYNKFKRKDAKSYMIAISMGGMIGINWLNSHKKDYDKAFIFNSSLPKFCSLFERLLPDSIPTLLSGAISSDPVYREKQIQKIIINHQDKNKDIWKGWSKVSKNMPVSFPNTLRQLWAAMRSPNPEKVSTPIFIGVSENDRMVSSNCSKRMAKAWNLPIFTHPTAGHDILNDDPKWLAEIVAKNI